MEYVADDIEILDELLDEPPSEPTPLHRFQGIFLFFSISLGALGLGASLAYFTREIRPARQVSPRARASRRTPAPSTPGLQELVTLPLKPALDAGDEDMARRVSRRQPPGPTRPVRTRHTKQPVVVAASAMVAAPILPPTTPAVPTKTEPASQSPSTPTTPAPAGNPPSVIAPASEPAVVATSAPAAPSSAPLAAAAAAEARGFLEKLSALLKNRYAFESRELLALAGEEGPMAPEQEVALPSWMNLVYLERLTSRALQQLEASPEALSVTSGEFGAGALLVELGDAETPGLRLQLQKPAAETQVALVVDDVGYGGSSTRDLLDLQTPFSVAILPFYPGSTWSLKTSIEQDLEPMLHLPMLPKGAVGKYRNNVVIGPDLPAAEILSRARRAIESLPGIVGVNNHMGSRATESWFVMGEVLPVIREKGLFFVDSVTSNRSVAFRSARKLGLRTAKRTTGFLDNDPSYEGVKAAFQGLLRRCKPGQRHVAILHDKHESVRAMREAIPLFRDRDIELAFAGDMVE